jgi:hypothetical protein
MLLILFYNKVFKTREIALFKVFEALLNAV